MWSWPNSLFLRSCRRAGPQHLPAGLPGNVRGGQLLLVSYWKRRRKTVSLGLPSAEHGLLMLWKLLYFHFNREVELEKKQNTGGICIAHRSPLTRASLYFTTGRYCPETRLVVKFNRHSTGGKTGNKRKSKKWQGRDLFWDFSKSFQRSQQLL